METPVIRQTSPMPAELPPTVSSVYINHLIDVAQLKGADLTEATARLGLDPTLLADINARVPFDVEDALYAEILRQLGDTWFGLHTGENVRPSSVGVLGYATMSSRNLGEAVGLMLRYEHFRSEAGSCEMAVDDQTFSITWHPFDDRIEEHRHRVEAAFSSWVSYGRWITRTQHNPLRVQFRHQPPGNNLSEYERIFQCPVEFGCAENRVTLDASLLDIPLADADADVNRLMRTRIEQVLANYQARGNFLAQVRLAMNEALPLGAPSLESIADSLGLKPWTLRRRLSAEGADFSSLLEQVRIDLAQQYLADPEHAISDIASLLGYSEQSAFNRAFKRWFQCTPAAYRQQIIRNPLTAPR